MASELSERWHRQVEGIWHGCPAIHDQRGEHQGHVQADRSIFVDGEGQHLIRVDTRVDCGGSLRARLETPSHLLRVKHVENRRVYDGPDFYGAGYPYGSLILGNDYCVPWATDNRVTVQLLGGELQAYSNVAYQGNSLLCVISGLYRVSRDFASNPDTRAAIERHRASELTRGRDVHLLPQAACVYRGALETYAADQTLVGSTDVVWRHAPDGRYRALHELELTGACQRRIELVRTRHENRHFYEGGLYGNGLGFGRALFWRGNLRGETTRIVGRDFMLENGALALVWELWRADLLELVLHGVLTPHAD